MTINSIDIISFGIFQDFHVNFDKNLNVIYGNTENGRTTIIDFIKMVFYGSPSIDRKADVLSNDRLKYRSNNNNLDMGGAIDFSFDDKNYRLHRIFRNSNNTDDVTLFNLSDNKDVTLPNDKDVGKFLFNINKQSFSKSLFINQVSTDSDEKATEILTNLIETCDQNTSSNGVLERLNIAKENYLSKSGKVGILDKNRNTLASLYDDIEIAKREESKKLQMQIEYQSVKEDRETIIERYNELKRTLDIQNMMEDINTLKNTVAKFDRIFELNDEISDRKKSLTNENVTVDNTFINNAQQKMIALQQIGETKNQMQSKVYKLKKDIEIMKENLDNSYVEEHKLLDEAIQQIDFTLGHIENIDKSIEDKRKEITQNSENITNAEVEFRVVDEQLKSQQEIAKQRLDIAQQQLDDARQPRVSDTPQNSATSFIWLGIGMVILGIIIVIFASSKLFLVISLVGIIMILSSYIEKNNAIQKQKNYNRIDEIAVSKATENIQKVRHDIGIEQQFLIKKQRETKKQLNLLKLNEEQLLADIDKFEQQKKVLEKNIEYWKNQKAEMEKIFEAEQSKLDKKQSELDNILDNIASSEKKFTNAQNEIIHYINMFKPCDSLNEVAKAISTLNSELTKIKDLENKRDYQQEVLKSETDGETYENLKDKLADLTADFIEMCGKENPEPMSVAELSALKTEINDCQASLNIQDKDLSYINSDIRANFKNTSSITEIEHNINNLERTIASEEQLCRSIDLALDVLNQTILEMKEYTSILNQKTAKIFNQITKDSSYENIVISKIFDDTNTNNTSLSNWHYLSNGTMEQASISLKLGVSQMISENSAMKSVPVVIDDIFIQYDDKSMINGLVFLKDYSKTSQVIMFTAHKNVVSTIQDNDIDANVISVSN